MGRLEGKTNQRKHGISFATATELFADPNQVVSESCLVDGEPRLQVTWG